MNEALNKLAAQNKAEAELVKLRYFVGMTLDEAAEALGISARTADNYWAHARAWLFHEFEGAEALNRSERRQGREQTRGRCLLSHGKAQI